MTTIFSCIQHKYLYRTPRFIEKTAADMEILTHDIGALTIKTEEEEKSARSFGPWASPTTWNFDSILTAINSNETSPSENGLGFKWNWKWEPIDFKTASIRCPKALNTLLGRGYSAISTSGLPPSPCSIPTNGCTCQRSTLQSHTPVGTPHTNIHNGSDNDANHTSAPPSSALAGVPPIAVEILPEIPPVGSPIRESLSLQSDQNTRRDIHAEDNNNGSVQSQENAQSLEDGELEEGQLSGEWLEEEDLEDECRQPSDLSETKEQDLGYNCSFMLHDAAFSAQKTEENKLQNPGEARGVKRKRRKRKNKQQDQKKAKNGSGVFAGSAKPQNNEQNQKKAQDGRGSVPGSEKLPKKRSAPDIGANSGSPNGPKEKLKASESLDEESPEKAVTDAGQIQAKGTAKKNLEISLSSLLEGEISLWTTETVEEVLHDMKVEKIGNKKAHRRPLTAARKEKKKITKKKKRALKNEQLGVKRLKLAPVIQSKPVAVCKFYVKGQCNQGKNCSFSHDTIPITKSEICKYHVNHCCLKGEECPFSHDLSAFPCKFYHSKGYCNDGDTCRFSHKPITGNALQERDELENKELCPQESVQSGVCHNIANSMQNSDIHHEFSVGNKIENVTYVESSKAALESKQQLPEKKGASSIFPKLGNVTPDKSSNTALVMEQKISKEKEANLQVPSILSFQQHEGSDLDVGAKGGNAALVAAKKAASMALAAVAGHEANLISCGLIRIPTFISHGDTDDNHLGFVVTDREDKEVPEQSRDELLEGGNHKIPSTRLLNSSKSAMEILEDFLCDDVEFEKDSRGKSTLGLFPCIEKKQNSGSDNG